MRKKIFGIVHDIADYITCQNHREVNTDFHKFTSENYDIDINALDEFIVWH